MGRLFGTDGVRGVVGVDLTCDLAFRLGQAGACVLIGQNKRRPRILIGRDTRLSGTMLEAAMAAGICSVGAQAVSAGVIPTPGIAYLTRKLGFDAGVVISASHNPYEFNGIKFFDGDGFKLSDSLEDEIEAIAQGIKPGPTEKTDMEVGVCRELSDAGRQYIDYLQNTTDVSLEGLRVVLDCANGAASGLACTLFTEMGAEVVSKEDAPNGININRRCGSTHMQGLVQEIKKRKRHIGFAFDGDADRMLAVDENGEMIDGDKIMMICGYDLMRRGLLKDNTIVTTVMSNLGLDIAARDKGIGLEKTKVGDRYVLEKMIEGGYNFGGEQSGHLIFLDHNTTGDGMMSALQLASVMKRTGKTLSELALIIKPLPQVLVNVRMSQQGKEDYASDISIMEMIEALSAKYNGTAGRVLIRPSGTEPLVRIMIEGSHQAEIEKDAHHLAALMKEHFPE
ncbi:MAG: phosphoglucosamine mutase [Christensenellales bacterium]|jgi:phosphoglucosamine mutase